MRDTLGPDAWASLCDLVLQRLRTTVPEPFERVAQMLFAVGSALGTNAS